MMGYSVDTTLAHNLTWWRNAVLYQDMDFVCFVDGKEGSGKSLTLAPQVARFMDAEHRLDLDKQYYWELDRFVKAVMTMPKGRSVVLDEAGRYLDRRETGSETNIRIRKLLWECRRRNLFLFFVMPSFYDADMSVAVHRSRVLLHAAYRFKREEADYDAYSIPKRPLQRGLGRFYTETGKKLLYTNDDARRRYAYPIVPNESFDFSYPEHYVFPKDDYKALRDAAEEEFFKRNEKSKGECCPECGGRSVRVAKRTGFAFCAKSHSWTPAKEAAS
jgi:hypothetical protein